MSSSHETAFSLLIAALGKSLGLDGAVPEDGLFRLEAGGRPLSIVRQGDAATLYCSLGTLPRDKAEADELRAVLLSANVLYRGTYGACLGVAPEDGVITLCYQTVMHAVTEEGFVRIVENFLTLVEHWEKRLEEVSAAPSPESGTAMSDPSAPGASWMRA